MDTTDMDRIVRAWSGPRDRDEDYGLTPRTAWVLHTAAVVAADEGSETLELHGEDAEIVAGQWSVFDELPEVTWRQPAAWRRRFLTAFDVLRDELAAGRPPLPRSTAQEMALHLMLARARAYTDAAVFAEDIAAIPARIGDFRWHVLEQDLFQDHDVLELYDPDTQLLDDSTVHNQVLRGEMFLYPKNWFEPFDPE